MFEDYAKEMNDELKRLMKKKDELSREVTRLRGDNNALLARNIAKSREMQSEIINLPQDLNEIHFYLLKLKEDFLTTLVAKERNEETHTSERLLFESQSRNDIQNRDRVIEALSQDNKALRSELEKLRTAHDKQSQKLTDQEEILDQCQQKIASLVVKNDTMSSDLGWKVEDLSTSKVGVFPLLFCLIDTVNRRNSRKKLQCSGTKSRVFRSSWTTVRLFRETSSSYLNPFRYSCSFFMDAILIGNF